MEERGAGGRAKALPSGAAASAARDAGAAERTEAAAAADHPPHHRRRVVDGSSAARTAPDLPRVLSGGAVATAGAADSLHRFCALAARLPAGRSVREAGWVLEGSAG